MISMLMMLISMKIMKMNLNFWCLNLIVMWLMIWRTTLTNSLQLDLQAQLWMVRSTFELYQSSMMMSRPISSWEEFLKIMHSNRKHLTGNLQELSKWIVSQQSPQRDTYFRNISIWIWKEKMSMWINIFKELGSISMLIKKEPWMR